jgi:NADH-quinone oxidoreductase subunit H
MIKSLYYFLIIPGFLFSAAFGLLSCWFDRKLTARVQWRQGPPWFQPFVDIIKLLGKEVIVPSAGNKMLFLSAPLMGLAAATLVSTMLWILNVNTYGGFVGDLIVIIYLLMIPSIALMLGGASTANPLSAIGVSREMKLMLAYELPFLVAVLTIVFKAKSILIGGIVDQQIVNGMNISSISGTLAFIVAVLVAQAKLGMTPFDIAEAEQELMGGPLLEYSGAPLAVFKLTKAIMLFIMPVLLITLFLGGIDITSFAGLMWTIFKYVIILVVFILIKNTNPRLRIDQAMRFFWGPVLFISVLGLVLALIGI